MRWLILCLWSALVWWSLLATPVEAQENAGELFQRCAAGADPGAQIRSACAQSALAAHALQGGVAFALSAGGAHPVSPSTAGSRIEGSPRIVVDGGLNVGSVRHADLTGTDLVPRETRSTVAAARITGSAGIWEGFSPGATVGGVGSLDAVGTLRIARLSSGDGFDGSVASLGGGVRLGIFRESFSLPGVTLTTLYHRPGTVRYGDEAATGRRMAVEPRVLSTRLEVGKDLLAMGLTGGMGWDRISGRAQIRVQADGVEASSGELSIRQNRTHFFAGANYTWLVTQFSAEVGWVPGVEPRGQIDPVPGVSASPSGLHGSITFRVRY